LIVTGDIDLYLIEAIVIFSWIYYSAFKNLVLRARSEIIGYAVKI
jgi:hypothetical protein